MKIEFTKEYAVFKKGDTLELDGMIATSIIGKGVAKAWKPKKTKSKK